MVQTFQWWRLAVTQTGALTATNRTRFSSQIFQAPFTLERVIIHWEAWQQFTEGSGASPPNGEVVHAGLMLWDADFDPPDTDPGASPQEDWLYAQMCSPTVRHRSGYTGVGFDQGYFFSRPGWDVRTRRTRTGDHVYRVSAFLGPLPANGAGSRNYVQKAYVSVLISVP